MRILAFDISRHCGWAHDRDAGGAPFSGVEHFPQITGDKDNGFDFGPCGDAALEFFHSKIIMVKPELVGAEAPLAPQHGMRARNESSARNSLGLVYMCEAVAHRCGVRFQEVNTNEMKAFFAGTTRGGKEPVKARCRQLGWPHRDDNECDALGVFAFLKACHEPQFAYQSTPLFAGARS